VVGVDASSYRVTRTHPRMDARPILIMRKMASFRVGCARNFDSKHVGHCCVNDRAKEFLSKQTEGHGHMMDKSSVSLELTCHTYVTKESSIE